MSTSTNNISLAIKYIFLNFAQTYFGAEHNRFTWNVDPRVSKVIIADKYAIDIGVAVQRPSIILSRGAAAWTYAVRGQQGWINPHREGNVKFGIMTPPIGDDRIRGTEFVDLYSASVTYNCVAKQGVEAEDLANKLFMALTAHKRDFASMGVHKFTSMSISEERVLRHRGDAELSGVSVNVGFLMQQSLGHSDSLYNCRVWSCGDEQFEGLNFDVVNNGTQIEFYEAPEDACPLLITYVDAVTLETRTLVSLGTGDGTTTVFTIPNGGSVYGYYKILEGIVVNMDVESGEREQTVLIGTE